MMRKMLSIILVFGLVVIVFGSMGVNAQLRESGISGFVWDCGTVEVWDGATGDWSCTNITIYTNATDRVVDDGSEDKGLGGGLNDEFFFDAGWREEHEGRKGIAVGEAKKDEINYVFITDFTIVYRDMMTDKWLGECEDTEWEPIPTPIVYAKGDGWINISIPKFTNPQKELYDNLTTNTDNTIGFAVYRNGLFVGNTTSFNNIHYFYNDTEISATAGYNYSVAVIAKGNHTTYSKSSEVKAQDGDPLQVTLTSPNGNKIWTGGNSHDISYTITGGSPPYNVALSYSTNGGATYPNTINDEIITHNEEGAYTYEWSVPEINSINMVAVRINVTDYKNTPASDKSSVFTIDSTPPTIDWTKTTPEDGATKVSIKKDIWIYFSEKMNKTATQPAFELSPDVSHTISWIDDATMKVEHDPFEKGETYTCNVTTAAKDKSEPGNYLSPVSWSFTTAAGVGVSVISPNTTSIWTGGSPHSIVYEIAGGEAPYSVNISYSDGTVINTTIVYEEKKYTCPWNVPSDTDSKTAQVIVNVTDNVSSAEDTSGDFEIDSTAPFIVDYTGNDTYITTTESIMVVFSEGMNPASVGVGAVQAGDAFVLFEEGNSTKIAGTITWNEAKNTMTFKPDANLTPNMNYTATVNTNTTDKSDPGNNLTADVSWSFIAVEGRGDLIVGSPIISPSPEKGKTSTITVTVSNTGPEAFNISGFLTVKFYASKDTTFSEADLIDTKYIPNIWAGNSSSAVTTFTFDDYGDYYFLVEVTSNNPADTFPGGEKTGRASASVNIPKPAEEIGLGPYTLIALMVVIVVIIAVLILLSLKKKGELTPKEKTKEEKEEEEIEEEKESEEEK